MIFFLPPRTMKQKECIYKSVDTEERSSNDGDYPAIFKQTYSRTEWYRNMFHFREWESFLVPLFSRYLIYLVHILLFSCSVSLAAWALTHRSAPADSCPRCYVDDEQCTIHMSARCEYQVSSHIQQQAKAFFKLQLSMQV